MDVLDYYSADPRPPYSGQLTAVGICLLVVAGLNLLGSVVYGILQVIGLTMQSGRSFASEAEQVGFFFGAYGVIILVVLAVLICPVIIMAGINMLRRRGLGLVKWGSILACIPLLGCCCFLQIPFGIWALVLLSKPEVKQQFM